MNTIKNSRVAIVTGASRGIGAAVAQRLANDGFAVVINYASGSKEADALVAELTAQGAKAIAVKADVSNADDVRAMFEATEQQLGKVDVLVNNAGVLKTVPLAETSDALYDQTFNINVRGTFNTLREAAARMNAGGRIVNFSSTTLALNMPGYAIYNATKSGCRSLHPRVREGTARPRHHGERCGTGSDCDFAVPRWQDRRTDPDVRQNAAAATPRAAR
jgi:3-oxoacyl-[acyl-carrier protein] reductase